MGPELQEPAPTLEIRDLGALRAVADPRRKQIIDLLRRSDATVKELAAAMQVPPKSLYYHVNLLEKHGLIRVVSTRLVSGILEKRYRATAYLFLFEDVMEGTNGTRAERTLEVLTNMLAITTDDLRLGLESGLVNPDDAAPPGSQLMVNWMLLRLSPERRKELEERIAAILQTGEPDEPVPAGAQVYRYLMVSFPVAWTGELPDTSLKEERS